MLNESISNINKNKYCQDTVKYASISVRPELKDTAMLDVLQEIQAASGKKQQITYTVEFADLLSKELATMVQESKRFAEPLAKAACSIEPNEIDEVESAISLLSQSIIQRKYFEYELIGFWTKKSGRKAALFKVAISPKFDVTSERKGTPGKRFSFCTSDIISDEKMSKIFLLRNGNMKALSLEEALDFAKKNLTTDAVNKISNYIE